MKSSKKILRKILIISVVCLIVEMLAFVASGFQPILVMTILMSIICVISIYLIYKM